ncbi:MAG TPA: putative lipid II flippase FtsW [Candidatus Acidoferrales bacterium]
MPRRFQTDRILFAATLSLCLIGTVIVFSASAVVAREQQGSPYTFLIRHLLWLGVGLAAMLLLMQTDYRRLKSPAVVFTAIGIVLAMLVAVLFLDRSHQTHRWIRFGHLSLQPSEFAKPVVVLFLAWFLERRRRLVNHVTHTLLPAFGLIAVIAGLVMLEPDFGTAGALLVISVAMLFSAGLWMRYLAYGGVAALPALYFAIFRVRYRYERVLAFLDPYADPQGRGFQMIQSLIAVGSGGVFGVGLMESHQKLFYLPEAHTDFIYAVLAEELGLVGALLVVGLFGIFCWRGLRAAAAAPDEFGRLAGVGLTVMVTAQALINLSVVLGLMPTKGIPLPFISYGGSSLVVMLAGTGILLNLSQHAD